MCQATNPTLQQTKTVTDEPVFWEQSPNLIVCPMLIMFPGILPIWAALFLGEVWTLVIITSGPLSGDNMFCNFIRLHCENLQLEPHLFYFSLDILQESFPKRHTVVFS